MAVLTLFCGASDARADALEPCHGSPTERLATLRTDPARLVTCQATTPLEEAWVGHAQGSLGHHAEAAAHYRKAADDELLAPVALLAAARSLQRAGALDAASQTLAEAQIRGSQPRWLLAEFSAARAELDWARGKPKEAIQAARSAIALGHPSDDSLGTLVVEALLRVGRRAEAVKALRTLRIEQPSAAALVALEARAGGLGLPSVENQLSLADLARRWARLSARAQADLVGAECTAASSRLAGRGTAVPAAELECGRALAALRDPRAEAHLRRATSSPTLSDEALLVLARAVARGGKPEAVEAICREMREGAGGNRLTECLFLAGMMSLTKGDTESAHKALEALAQSAPNHARAADARWFLAFDTLRRSPTEALPLLEALSTTGQPSFRAQASYWLGVARLGRDEAGSRTAFVRAQELDPVGYYGWLARARLGGINQPKSGICAGSRQAGDAPPPSASLAARLFQSGFLRQAKAALAAPLGREADVQGWAGFLATVGRYDRLLDLGLARGGEAPAWPPDPRTRVAAEAARPLAFSDALAGVPEGLDRCLVLSVMRRESRYDPEAVSAARARGLMQLLPETASRVAALAGLTEPTPDQLFDPVTNVRLGAEYLQRLVARFTSPLVAAAAYNAGPNAVTRWIADRPGLPLDEWVELIPYRETRAYVKAVGGSYAAYSLIYGDVVPPLSLAPVGPPGPGVDF